MFDCIIVGAGPAGGTAAYHLAKQGRSVLVLEKANLPRYKPCSGGVSPAIAQWFDFDFSPVISLKTRTIRTTWKLEDPVEVELKLTEPIWLVQRDRFDQFILQQAQNQGATLQDGTEVTQIHWNSDHWDVSTPSDVYQGRFLIAADGVKGPLAAWLGFKPRPSRLTITHEVEVATESVIPRVDFEFGLVKNGYLWNFPKATGYSISLGTFRGGDLHNWQKPLSDYLQSLHLSPKQGQTYEHVLCLWDGDQPLHTQNALLAGDTAGLVDPFTGEGIRPAILSGVRAATAIDRALAGDPDALATYTQTLHEEWGSDMVWAQRLAGLFYRIPGIAYRVGVKRPIALQRMAELLCGELRYSEIANVAIKRLAGVIPGLGG